MVGLLEDLVGADAGLFHQPVALHVERRAVDVDAADLAAVLGGVDDLHRVGDGLGAVVGVLAVVDHQALVALADEGVHLGPQLVVGEGAADDLVVVVPEAAVRAGVDALVADVERGEEDDAVAVDVLLELARRGEHLLLQSGRRSPRAGRPSPRGRAAPCAWTWR